jgi:hypothetical protein
MASAGSLAIAGLLGRAKEARSSVPRRKTTVSIRGKSFLINGKPTYRRRSWEGMPIEGLLMNSRMVQGIFDDENPDNREEWKYPSGPFDPDRNTREFVEAMPQWRRHGLLGFTINLQGGSPYGYGGSRIPTNSAFDYATGALKAPYMARLEHILDAADQLGMVAILGFFYQGQAPRFTSEQAVIAATDGATDWLIAKAYTNVLVEIANECDATYPDIIKPSRAHELITRVQQRSSGKLATPARRLLVSTSYTGRTIPGENVAQICDFILLHGNSVTEPSFIATMVEQTRALSAYRGQPIVFNEDDHYDFDKTVNNFIIAVSTYAGWGFFDYRRAGEGFEQGFQSIPVDWRINSNRKLGFFDLLAKIAGCMGRLK